MPKEQPQSLNNLKVGDRLSNGARVTDTRHAKQRAIGFEYDDPETIARVDKLVADYAAESRRRQYGPWTLEELQEMIKRQEAERRFQRLCHLPLDSSI